MGAWKPLTRLTNLGGLELLNFVECLDLNIFQLKSSSLYQMAIDPRAVIGRELLQAILELLDVLVRLLECLQNFVTIER